MNVQYIIPCYNFSAMMAEDAATPELRNPNNHVYQAPGKLLTILKKLLGRSTLDAELVLIDPKDRPDPENEKKISAFCEWLS